MRALPRIAASALIATTAFLTPVPARAVAIIRNPGQPHYTVRLRAGDLGHRWTGTESISFTNLDAAPLVSIWLRLWSNGVLGCGANSIVISNLVGGTAGVSTQACTAIPVTLDSPVVPGATGSISMRVAITVPALNDRFGYHGGLSLMGTALPTLAISDDTGWHTEPFIDLGESFYSIVGTYRVTLDTPAGLQTATTGARVAHHVTAGRSISTYEARRVRDFEWAAGHLQRLSGKSGSTPVRVWYSPAMTTYATAAASLAVATHSMDTFSAAFGRYPYAEVDVVLTGFTTFGGMEYPTIVFTDPGKYTIAHELAHQWWYGIVGDNQYAEPWLDESFATWSEVLPYGGWRSCSSYAWPSATASITNDMAYWSTHPGEYDTIYGGGGCMLANLSHRFGFARFKRILKSYAAGQWFGVARTADFKAVIATRAATALPGFNVSAFWATWRVS